jgi:hypothetical protein
MREFDFLFRDLRKLNTFIKTCEALCAHSDTVLIKVKKRGIYLLLTDFESMCIAEARLTKFTDLNLKLHVKEFTAKILLDSLITLLRKGFRNKMHVMLFGNNQHQLFVQEVSPMHNNTNVSFSPVEVASTEHRIRVYHIISTRDFIHKSDDYIKFKIMNTEFNKIITAQAILSGLSGGVAKLHIKPTNSTDAKIIFSLRNNSGSFGKITIHTSTTSEDVPILHMCQKDIDVTYLLTYLKRSQNMLSFPTEYVQVYVSNKGIIIHTELKDGMCTIVFTINITETPDKTVDLDSFV